MKKILFLIFILFFNIECFSLFKGPYQNFPIDEHWPASNSQIDWYNYLINNCSNIKKVLDIVGINKNNIQTILHETISQEIKHLTIYTKEKKIITIECTLSPKKELGINNVFYQIIYYASSSNKDQACYKVLINQYPNIDFTLRLAKINTNEIQRFSVKKFNNSDDNCEYKIGIFLKNNRFIRIRKIKRPENIAIHENFLYSIETDELLNW